MPTIRAIISDFDGVLVDCEPLHSKAWMKVLAELGIHFTQSEYDERYLGLNDPDFLVKIFSEHNRTLDTKLAREWMAKKGKEVDLLLHDKIPVIEGAEEFLAKTFAKKIPLVLVTNSMRAEVDYILKAIDFQKYFTKVITANDVQRGKPDPEGYLKAFQFLTSRQFWNPPLQKSDCLVLEDSATGMAAARAAGLPVRQIQKTLKGLDLV